MEFFKLSSLKFYIACLLLFCMCGCGVFKPFVDRRRNPGVSDPNMLYVGESKPWAPVICYNPLITGDEELQQMADNVCINEETGDYAEFVKKSYLDGKLLLPARVYYKCVKKGMENLEEDKNEPVIGE